MISKRLSLLLIVSLIVGTSIYMVGCGDYESPIAGDSTNTRLADLPPLDDFNILPRSEWGGEYELMPSDDEWSNYVAEILGRRGGEVTLQDIELDIPNNAIPQGEEVEVSILIPDPSLYLFDLGPDGYVFQKEIKIRVYLDNADLDGIDPETIVFITYDEESGVWVSEGGEFKEKDNYIEAKIGHFSYWALASD